MSYILDAIKKTESGEKDGDVPNLNSEHQHTAFVEDDESRRWLIPMLVVIGILLSVVIWLLLKPANVQESVQAISNQSSQDNLQANVQESSQTSLNNEQPLSAQAKLQIDTNTVTAIPEPSAETASSQSGVIIKKAPLEIQQPVVQVQPQIQPQKVVETISTRPVTEVVQGSGSVQKPVQQSMQQPVRTNDEPVFLAAIDHDHWPTLIYTTHIYATDPDDRFVMLNGKVYSIGDTITKGMVIADILENDLLVEYQGQKVIVPGLSDVNP